MSNKEFPELLSKALAAKGVTFDKSAASRSTNDQRYTNGAVCTWHGPIHEVGKMAGDVGLPCCPYCKGPLFESPSATEWWEGVNKFTETHPGYRLMLEWQTAHKKCFPNFDVLRMAYATESGILVQLDNFKERP